MIKIATDWKKLTTQENDLVLCAPAHFYKHNWHHKILTTSEYKAFDKLLKSRKLTGKAFSLSHYCGEKLRKVSLVALSDQVSHSNSGARKNETHAALSKLGPNAKTDIIFGLENPSYTLAAIGALARLVELYNRKSDAKKRAFHAAFSAKDGSTIKADPKTKSAADAIPWACFLVDSPAEEINPTSYGREIKKRFSQVEGVKYRDISGDNLKNQGFGGAHAVGRAASEPPRVVILEYKPKAKAHKKILLVGKGVTYDTGGLNLKISGSMSEMKCDMAGSAAVLAAFEVLAKSKSPQHIVAIVGLVENAIGPKAYRPDDILHMHSGKTVEINNTDAEGRLVLADCMSYGCRTFKPDLAIEAATLTGSQLVATGVRHAGIVVNKKALNDLAEKAAQSSGDLVAPLPFAPEFFQEEFASTVADMRNSVKNRMNAQTSCAAQFIYSHIDDLDLDWMHIDLAGPAFSGSRATGYGVGLLTELVSSYDG